MGNALGKGGSPTVVTGSITGLHQTITASDDSGANAETLHDLIQTDAPIQPGDSGGPLVDQNGKVIGMDSAASTSQGFGFQQSSSSEGYAIPIENALRIARQIADGNESDTVHVGDRGILGVELQSSDASNGFGFGSGNDNSNSGSSNGATIAGVASGSPADKAGLAQGDTITKVGDTTINSTSDLSNAMDNHHPGDHVSVSWTDSNGNSHTANVTLEAGPPA
jgi:S1-C subfamily serine protease